MTALGADGSPDRESHGLPLGDVPERPARTIDLPVPARALAIVAHPDDAEFQCGGTLAKWAAAGCVINHLVLTDGSKGTWDADADIDALVDARRQEQLEAARRLGSAGKVVMLGHVDGELQSSLSVRDQVAWWIRALTPDVVLAHDPWKRYRLHPDHRHAGWLAVDGIVAARDPHYFRHHEHGAHRPRTLLLFEADRPDHLETITSSLEAKIDALLAHRSQFVTTHGIDADDDGRQADQFARRVRAHSAAVGAAGGSPGAVAAEAFTRIDEL